MKIILTILFWTFFISGFSQSLKDSLFAGRIKVDTGKITIIRGKIEEEKPSSKLVSDSAIIKTELDSNLYNTFTDSSTLISVDTSELSIEIAQKEWRKFILFRTPPLEPEQILKYQIPKGIYTVFADFIISPDGSVRLIKVTCPPEVSFLESILTGLYANPPKQIPNHQGMMYKKTIKRQSIKFEA